VQIELRCGYTKGDEFVGFPAFKQLSETAFDLDNPV
jgi:hypothetical protein